LQIGYDLVSWWSSLKCCPIAKGQANQANQPASLSLDPNQ
jgi:hypothetical protein